MKHYITPEEHARMQRRRGRQRIMKRTTGQTPLISLVIIEIKLHQSADQIRRRGLQGAQMINMSLIVQGL